jgi:hypothetical protein
MVLALVFVSSNAFAQEATDKPASPTWAMVQSACGGEYRAAKADANRPTWIDFLNTCKVRKGFVAKRAGKVAVTLPDVN